MIKLKDDYYVTYISRTINPTGKNTKMTGLLKILQTHTALVLYPKTYLSKSPPESSIGVILLVFGRFKLEIHMLILRAHYNYEVYLLLEIETEWQITTEADGRDTST